jgi:hypothetical protein
MKMHTPGKHLTVGGIVITGIALSLSLGMRFYLWARVWIGEFFCDRDLP